MKVFNNYFVFVLIVSSASTCFGAAEGWQRKVTLTGLQQQFARVRGDLLPQEEVRVRSYLNACGGIIRRLQELNREKALLSEIGGDIRNTDYGIQVDYSGFEEVGKSARSIMG